MKDQVTKSTSFKSSPICAFLISGILGGIIYLIIFGTLALNPTSVDWISAEGGDMLQHQIGWDFYRNTSWKFPIGLIDGLVSSGSVSCLYTDSIPFFAVFFKILSPILPETFQYFGIWEMFCFIMSGGVSAALLYKIKPNYIFSTCGSIVYMLFPPITCRYFHHDSLIAIWIVLLAFILCIDQNKEWKHKSTPVILWSGLGMISVLTHMYFLPMIYMVMAAYIIVDVFKNKKIAKSIWIFASTTVCTVITLFCIGAFYGKGHYNAGGLGVYSANFNTFFSGYPVSQYIGQLPRDHGQYEGYGYLGLGVFVLIFIDIIICLILLKKKDSGIMHNIAEYIKKNKVTLIAVFLLFTVSFLWSVSPKGMLNNRVLYDIQLPSLIFHVLSIYRATGRFVWLSGLLVITISFYIASKIDGKKAAAIAVLCLAVQTADTYKWFIHLHNMYGKLRPLKTNIVTEHWDELTENANEIIFLPLPENYLGYGGMYFNFAKLASEKNMKLSSFYVARGNYDILAEYASEQYELLKSGDGREDAIYVFFNEDDIPKNVSNVKVYNIDGYTVAKVEN